MTFKFIVFAAVLAYANAGVLNAPYAYSPAPAVSSAYYSTPVATAYATGHVAPVAPVAVHAPAIGATHQSVLRSLGGDQAVSHYSKAVDDAFSTVRKYDTRITNDAISLAYTPVAYAAPAAPVLAHAAPIVSAVDAAPVAVRTALAHPPAVTVAHTNFEGLGVHYAY